MTGCEIAALYICDVGRETLLAHNEKKNSFTNVYL